MNSHSRSQTSDSKSKSNPTLDRGRSIKDSYNVTSIKQSLSDPYYAIQKERTISSTPLEVDAETILMSFGSIEQINYMKNYKSKRLKLEDKKEFDYSDPNSYSNEHMPNLNLISQSLQFSGSFDNNEKVTERDLQCAATNANKINNDSQTNAIQQSSLHPLSPPPSVPNSLHQSTSEPLESHPSSPVHPSSNPVVQLSNQFFEDCTAYLNQTLPYADYVSSIPIQYDPSVSMNAYTFMPPSLNAHNSHTPSTMDSVKTHYNVTYTSTPINENLPWISGYLYSDTVFHLQTVPIEYSNKTIGHPDIRVVPILDATYTCGKVNYVKATVFFDSSRSSLNCVVNTGTRVDEVLCSEVPAPSSNSLFPYPMAILSAKDHSQGESYSSDSLCTQLDTYRPFYNSSFGQKVTPPPYSLHASSEPIDKQQVYHKYIHQTKHSLLLSSSLLNPYDDALPIDVSMMSHFLSKSKMDEYRRKQFMEQLEKEQQDSLLLSSMTKDSTSSTVPTSSTLKSTRSLHSEENEFLNTDLYEQSQKELQNMILHNRQLITQQQEKELFYLRINSFFDDLHDVAHIPEFLIVHTAQMYGLATITVVPVTQNMMNSSLSPSKTLNVHFFSWNPHTPDSALFFSFINNHIFPLHYLSPSCLQYVPSHDFYCFRCNDVNDNLYFELIKLSVNTDLYCSMRADVGTMSLEEEAKIVNQNIHPHEFECSLQHDATPLLLKRQYNNQVQILGQSKSLPMRDLNYKNIELQLQDKLRKLYNYYLNVPPPLKNSHLENSEVISIKDHSILLSLTSRRPKKLIPTSSLAHYQQDRRSQGSEPILLSYIQEKKQQLLIATTRFDYQFLGHTDDIFTSGFIDVPGFFLLCPYPYREPILSVYQKNTDASKETYYNYMRQNDPKYRVMQNSSYSSTMNYNSMMQSSNANSMRKSYRTASVSSNKSKKPVISV